MPQENKRNGWSTVHRSTHPQGKQNGTKKNAEMAGISQKKKRHRIWSCKAVDNRLFQNVQDSRQSHKVHHESHEELESRFDRRRKNSCRSENPVRYLLRRCSFTITIRYSDDATQSHTKKMYRKLHIYKIARKNQPRNVHRWHQTVWKEKMKNNWRLSYGQ